MGQGDGNPEQRGPAARGPRGVEIGPGDGRGLRVDARITVPLRELEWSASASGGPGGQNVNRVNTKVTLRWPFERSSALPEDVRARLRQRHARRITAAGELVLSSQRYRSQPRNTEDCLEKLRELLLEIARPPRPRKPTRPTRGSVERRLTQKRQRSAAKRDRRSRSDD
jgi:ribosome-associated protein